MGIYSLPDLSYDYGALEPAMSGDILELHHSKHHAAYVKGANDTLDRIAEARDNGDFTSLVGLEKTMAFNLSGHVLHSIFWDNLSPDGGDRPDGELAAAIDEHLGGFEKFKAQLSAATTGVQGSGWGILSWEPLGQRLIIEQVYDHHGNVGQGSTPLLAFDAWEHAYYLQYRNVRPDYVQRLWDLVNWNDVIARFDAARGVKLAMSMPPFEAAQLAAGVLAARHRGDLRDAESLLGSFPDETDKTRGFHVLAELALSLVKAQTGQTMDELLQELSVQLAQAAQLLPPPQVDPGEPGHGRMDP